MSKGLVKYYHQEKLVSLLNQYCLHKKADASLSSIIKDFVMNYFNEIKEDFHKHPVATIIDFFLKGMLPFPLSAIWTIAEALGWDSQGFIASIGSSLTSAVDTDEKQVDFSKVDNAVSQSFNQNISGAEDEEKLEQVKVSSRDVYLMSSFVKNSGALGKAGLSVIRPFKDKIFKFLMSSLSWIIKTAFKALGFSAVGAAISKTVGKDKDTKIEVDPNVAQKLVKSPNIPSELTAYHKNDDSNIWIQQGLTLSNLEEQLIKWAKIIYPFLTNDAINKSSKFRNTISLIKSSNKSSSSFLVIPQPFESILDIIDSFAYDAAKNIT